MNHPHELASAAPLNRTRVARTTIVLSALLVMLLGGVLLYGAGFAQPAALHKAAHDGRHAFSLPCH